MRPSTWQWQTIQETNRELATVVLLALSVIGGMLVAMVLTLVVIPSLYLIVNGGRAGWCER